MNLFVDEENKKENLGATTILDRNGNTIAVFSTQRQKLIKLSRIPYFVSRGFLLIEDNRFYSHHGFNYVRMAIGYLENLATFGHFPAAHNLPTIGKNIVYQPEKNNKKKNLMNYSARLNSKKNSPKMKFFRYTSIRFFSGIEFDGIEGASQFYFGKDASELNIAEASLLIGMNRAPEIYSPVKSIDKAKIVQKIVLNQFVKAGFLTKENSKMEFDRFWNRFSANGVLGSQSFWKTDVNSGYATEFVRQALENVFHERFLKEYN